MPQSRIMVIPSKKVLRAWRPAHMPQFRIIREGHEEDMKNFFGEEFAKVDTQEGPFAGILLPRTEKLQQPYTKVVTAPPPTEVSPDNETETPLSEAEDSAKVEVAEGSITAEQTPAESKVVTEEALPLMLPCEPGNNPDQPDEPQMSEEK